MVLARPWDLRDSWSLTLAVLFHDAAAVLHHDRVFPQEGGAARAAYAQSFSFVEWLARQGGGPAALGRVAQRVGGGRPFVSAFALEFGMTPVEAVAAWRGSMGRWYRTVSVLTSTTTLWIGILVLVLLTALGQRRRRRRILARWELEEGPPDPEGPPEIDDRPLRPH
jgi:MYXO-CTERM domain-containing protein